jgi:guanine deaminase
MGLLIRGGLVLASAEAEIAPLDVLLEDDRIAAVAPSLAAAPGTEVLDAGGQLVIPGLINAHTHGRENLLKGLVDNRPLELWLHQLAAFSDQRTPREQYVSVALGAIEMLRSGVTSAYELFTNIPTVTPETIDAVLRAYRDVGLRAIVAPSIADLPYHRTIPGLVERLEPSLLAELDALFPPRDGDELLGIVRRAAADWARAGPGPVRVGCAPVIPERCTERLLAACRDAAAALGLPLHTHLLETKVQAVQRMRQDGCSTAVYLDRLGLLGPRTTLAHAVWTTGADLDAIARTGACVVHNPGSNMKLGSGVMPLRAMLDRGISVAVGADGSASSDNQNLFEALRLAAYLHRPLEVDYERWPRAREVLGLAWDGGARALDAAVGRIAPGYLADLALLDLDTEPLTPLNDAAAQLVMAETGGSVRTVIVAGRVVLADRTPTRVDAAAIRAEARATARRLLDKNRDRARAIARVEPYLAAARRALLAEPGRGR